MNKMENRIDIAKFSVNDMTFSKFDHNLIKENLRISEREYFDEDDRDEKNLSRKNHKVRDWFQMRHYLKLDVNHYILE